MGAYRRDSFHTIRRLAVHLSRELERESGVWLDVGQAGRKQCSIHDTRTQAARNTGSADALGERVARRADAERGC